MSVSAQTTTVADLARQLGVAFNPTTDALWATARASHLQRLENNAADRPLVNRTTVLWTALAVDPQVALAVHEGRLNRRRFAGVSNIDDDLETSTASGSSGSSGSSDVGLDPSLVDALTGYVHGQAEAHPLGVADIALAVLRSSGGTAGLLPGRLVQAGVDVPLACDALERLVTGTGVYGLSGSVRAVRASLGADTQVTAARLAQEVYGRHRYAGTEVTGLPVNSSESAEDTVDGWLRRVRESFDVTAVLASNREVIDGELTIRALTLLEPDLGGELETDPALSRWLQGIEPTPSIPSSRSTPTADEPAVQDLLGRAPLAVGLTEFFNALYRQGPASFVMHLDARWGEGKSSVLNLLKGELTKGQAEPRYLVVEVNAWREQQVGAQWWTLYRALRWAERDRANRRARIGLWARSARDLLVVRRHQVWPVLLTSVLVLTLGLIVILAGSGKKLLDLGTLQSVISLALLVGAGSATWLRFVAPTSARDARALVESDPSPMAEIRELFARTLRRQGGPTLFLVDDLDRCEPTYVVHFLETMQTLVRDVTSEKPASTGDVGSEPRPGIRGPYAIVAADGEWLRRSYVKHYADVFGNDGATNLGFAFLDKIFQLHVRLPDIDPRLKQDYYRRLLFGEITTRTASTAADDKLAADVRHEMAQRSDLRSVSALSSSIDQIQDPEKRQSAKTAQVRRLTGRDTSRARYSELARYATIQDSNPRTIRLFVNAMSLQIAVRVIESRPLDLDRLALWVTLERRWPDLASQLRQRPDDADLIVTDGTLPGDHAMLVKPDALLLMRHPRWGPLDAQAVRDCVGARTAAAPVPKQPGAGS